MSTPTQIKKVVMRFSKQAGLTWYSQRNDQLNGYVTGKHGRWQIVCLIGLGRLHFLSILPVVVSPLNQEQVMKYLTYANYGLPVGNFEMSLRSGEIRYKSGIFTVGIKLTPESVAMLFLHNIGIVDRYLPGLMQVLFSDANPATVIEELTGTTWDLASEAADLAELLDDVDLDQLVGPDDD